MAIPSITNNSPQAGHFAWGAFNIQLNGVTYAVPAGSSSQRWVWWEYRSGSPILNAGAEVPATLVDDDLVLFANKNGIGVRVQSTNFVDGELLVDGSIFAEALSTNLINSTHIVTEGLDAGVVKFGFMHGDRIQANTLVGDKIVSQTIGTNKLMVGSMDNLLNDPTFLQPLGATQAWTTFSGGSLVLGAGRGGGNVLRIANSSAQQASYNTTQIPCEPGEAYNLAMLFYQTGAAIPSGGVTIGARFRLQNGTFTWPTVSNTASIPVGTSTTASRIAGKVIAPDTAVLLEVYVASQANNSTGVLNIDFVSVTRAMTGELIVDGAIKSDHVVAEGLSADVIKFGFMHGDRIQSKTIYGDHLASDVILGTSRIAALGSQGQSVELKPDGFFVYGPDSENNPIYVNFPTEGGVDGKPNIISGALRATTLAVEGDPTTGTAATFRGTSELEIGASLIMNEAVSKPVTQPSVESSRNELRLTGTMPPTSGVTRGDYSQTFHGAEQAIYTCVPKETNGVWRAEVYKTLLSNAATTLAGTISAPSDRRQPMGITYLASNSSFYIMWMRSGGAGVTVCRYTVSGTTWSLQQTVNLASFTTTSELQGMGIGNDATSIWLVDRGSTTAGGIRFRRFTAALSTTVQETINTTFVPDNQWGQAGYFGSLSVGNFDFGARKFVLTYSYGALEGRYHDMAVFNTSGGYEVSSLVQLYRESLYAPGFLWTGTTNATTSGYFAGISVGSGHAHYLDRYDGPRMTVSAAGFRYETRFGGYTYHKTSPSQETTISSTAVFMMRSRWPYKLTFGAPPNELVAKVYISQSATENHNAAMRYQGMSTPGTTAFVGKTYSTTSANPPATTTFTSQTPARIVAQATVNRAMTLGTTNGSANITTTGANPFYRFMVGAPITGTGIPAGTVIESVSHGGTTATLSKNATQTVTASRNLILPMLDMRGDGDFNLMGDFISPVLPIRMASGVVNITVGSGTTTVYSTVVFPSGRFTKPPTVIAQQMAGNANFYDGGGNSVTTTQFTANASKTGPSGQTVIPIHWIAIQDS